MTGFARDDGRIDLIEVGGRGGVYQHTVAVAATLSAAGALVVVHTALDRECTDVPGVCFCPCMDWKRERKRIRNVRIAFHFLFSLIPHLIRNAGDAVWVQGTFKLPLTNMLLVILRSSRRTVAYSPHNTFSRKGSRLDSLLLSLSMRIADRVIVYNHHDSELLCRCGIDATVIPLEMYAPVIPESVLAHWSSRCDRLGVEVASVGQLRADKHFDVLVQACDLAGTGLVIAGPDEGALSTIQRAAKCSEHHVDVHPRYLDLVEIAAIVSSVKIVALPYSVASQSAVASLAAAYGTKVVAMDVGGLAEAADVVLDQLDVSSWAGAISSVCANTRIERRAVPSAAPAGLGVRYLEIFRS